MEEFISTEIERCKDDFDYWYKTYTKIVRKEKEMIIGFTGTQKGMSKYQQDTLIKFIEDNISRIKEVHHGDCIGADAQFDFICKSREIKRVIHPPIISNKRAFCAAEVILPEKGYLDRNKDIVDVCTILLAGLLTDKEELRSGTWATIRYARKANKEVLILKRKGDRRMTLREFLKELSVDITENTQGILDLELDLEDKGVYRPVLDVEICYDHNHIKMRTQRIVSM